MFPASELVTVTLFPHERTFEARRGETILEAAIRHGIALPYSCREGECGTCKRRVVKGSATGKGADPAALSAEDANAGFILTCRTIPQEALTLDCSDLVNLDSTDIREMPARVEQIEEACMDVAILTLRVPTHQLFDYAPGQYADIWRPEGVRRSYSMATPPSAQGIVEFHVRRLPGGAFSEQTLRLLKPRMILRLEGPYGSFYLRDSKKPIIFLAGGTGLAPIKAMIQDIKTRGLHRPMTLYWGVRSLADLYAQDVIGSWLREIPDFHYVPVLSEPSRADFWPGRLGYVHQAILEDFKDLSAHQVYACGSPAMIAAARADFSKYADLPGQDFFADAFMPRR